MRFALYRRVGGNREYLANYLADGEDADCGWTSDVSGALLFKIDVDPDGLLVAHPPLAAFGDHLRIEPVRVVSLEVPPRA